MSKAELIKRILDMYDDQKECLISQVRDEVEFPDQRMIAYAIAQDLGLTTAEVLYVIWRYGQR